MNLLSNKKNLKIILKRNMMDVIAHGTSVSNIAYILATELGLEEEKCYEIAIAGVLHDIGKIKLSSYLNGNDSLTFEETKYMRLHSKLSYDILKEKGFSDFILNTVLYHHENYDGSGYPDQLQGEDIPIGARILRVSDIFAALLSDRPYRGGFDVETAIQMMIEEVKNFDMHIFLAFQRVVQEVEVAELLKEKRAK